MRTLLASALLLGLAPLAAAQPTFGIRAGLNVASLSDFEFAGSLDSQPRLGFAGGVFAELPLNPSFAVRPEVLFAQKGETGAADGDDSDVTFALDYVEVPVLGRFALSPSPTLEAGLMAGPYAAFKLGESIDSGVINVDTDDVESVDYGVVVGGEVGSGPFFVDLRYALGLASVFDGTSDLEDSPRNGVFTVSAAYKFGR